MNSNTIISKQHYKEKPTFQKQISSDCIDHQNYRDDSLIDLQQMDQTNQFCFVKLHSTQQKQKSGDKDSTLCKQSVYESFNDLRLDLNNDSIENANQQIIQSNFYPIFQLSCYFQKLDTPTNEGISSVIKKWVTKKKRVYSHSINYQEDQLDNLSLTTDQNIRRSNISQNRNESSIKYKRSTRSFRELSIKQKFEDSITLVEQNKFNSSKSRIWKKSWLLIIYYISKVKRLSRYSSLFYRPQMLSKKQVNLINDIGSSMQFCSILKQKGKYELGRQFSYKKFSKHLSFKSYRKLVKVIVKYFSWIFQIAIRIKILYYSIISFIFQYLPLFHYLSGIYIIWEIIIFFCSALLFLYIPFEYSFQFERTKFLQLYLSLIAPAIFGLDMFIQANTKSTQTSSFIESHIQIFHAYMKSDFVLDLLSVLSLNYQIFYFNFSYFFFFVRINKSFRVLNLFREKFLLKMKISGVISLVYLLSQMLFFSHLISCFWYWICSNQLQQQLGWLATYEIIDQPIYIKYIKCFYYCVITMATIGYGDMTPQTEWEMLSVIVIAFISCGFFGYSINSIGNILSDFKLKNDQYLQEIAKLNKYFKLHEVDLELQARCRKYLDHLFSDDRDENICTIDSLQSLSESLQEEIKINSFTKRLKTHPILKQLFSEETLQQLSLKIKEKIYYPDQYISDITHKKEPIMYIIHSGAVSQYYSNEDRKLKEIKKLNGGQFFDMHRFYIGNYELEYVYKSNSNSCILEIPYSHFIEIIKKNEEEYQKFMNLKDQLTFNSNFGIANLRCQSCLQNTHQLQNCPFIFYQGNKQKILKRYFQEIDKKIQNFKRQKPRLKISSLFHQQLVLSQAEQFILNNKSTLYEFSIEEFCDSQEFLHSDNSINIQYQSQNQEQISESKSIDINNSKISSNLNEEKQHLSCMKQDRVSNRIISGEEIPLQQFQTQSSLQSIMKNRLSQQQINEQDSSIDESIKVKDGGSKIIKKQELTQEILVSQLKHQKDGKYKGVNSDRMINFNQITLEGSDLMVQKGQHFGSSLHKTIDKLVQDKLRKKIAFQLAKSILNEKIQDENNQKQKCDSNNQEQEIFLLDFDQLKVYSYYFPNGNYDQIIEKANQNKQQRYASLREATLRKRQSRYQKTIHHSDQRNKNNLRKSQGIFNKS